MHFTKMHGIGNDYIYFNNMDGSVRDPENLAVRLSDRHFSVGGDGIVLIMPSASADFRMRMFNADGSEGKMCGNATRCIGKYVYEKGLTDKTELTLETLSGIKSLRLQVRDGIVESVQVEMGRADFACAHIPVASSRPELIDYPLTVAGRKWRGTAVSMGNPHFVVFCPEVTDLPLGEIGPQFENHPLFPERVNTEFIRIIDPQTLEMRVWERGSGETMACGTGACAAVSAAVKTGVCKPDVLVTVRLLGGDLKIYCRSDGSVFMEGPAAFAFEGDVTV